MCIIGCSWSIGFQQLFLLRRGCDFQRETSGRENAHSHPDPPSKKGTILPAAILIFTTHCPVLAVLLWTCRIPYLYTTSCPRLQDTKSIQKLNRNFPYQSTNPVLSHSPACAGPITHAWSTKPYFWWTQGELHCEADAQRHAIQGAIEHHGLKSAISHEGYQTTIGWFLLIRFFFRYIIYIYISILIGENGRVADLSMTFCIKRCEILLDLVLIQPTRWNKRGIVCFESPRRNSCNLF